MKTVSKLRKEVLRDHLTKEISENEDNLYKLSKQLIMLKSQRETYVADIANNKQKIEMENEQTEISLKIGIVKDNISLLQSKLNIIERNILKSN